MRSVLVFVGVALLSAVICISDAATQASPPSADSAATILDPARPADRLMLAYGDAHPECRLWTNWEKLCSRTGRSGALACRVDPGRRLSPSEPFCAAARSVTPAAAAPDRERASSERFCQRRGIAENLSQQRLVRLCTGHDPRRPFNGRRVAALLVPGCDGLSEAASGRLLCVRGGDAGHPDCAALAARSYQHGRLLQCSRWSGDPSCHAFPIRGAPDTGEDARIIPRDPDRAGVHGLFCENR